MALMTMSARFAPTRADDVGERVSVLRLFLSRHEVGGGRRAHRQACHPPISAMTDRASQRVTCWYEETSAEGP